LGHGYLFRKRGTGPLYVCAKQSGTWLARQRGRRCIQRGRCRSFSRQPPSHSHPPSKTLVDPEISLPPSHLPSLRPPRRLLVDLQAAHAVGVEAHAQGQGGGAPVAGQDGRRDAVGVAPDALGVNPKLPAAGPNQPPRREERDLFYFFNFWTAEKEEEKKKRMEKGG